ncbi:hypothetical protein BT69DRAFT_527428 [Atractiella rhizophila]|nr:hypothetical protein BT69DRAFT_527428 [Atractiella rhizophila]
MNMEEICGKVEGWDDDTFELPERLIDDVESLFEGSDCGAGGDGVVGERITMCSDDGTMKDAAGTDRAKLDSNTSKLTMTGDIEEASESGTCRKQELRSGRPFIPLFKRRASSSTKYLIDCHANDDEGQYNA